MNADELSGRIRARLDEIEALAQAAMADDMGQSGGFEDAFIWLIRPPKRVAEDAARMIVHAAVPRRILADVAGKRKILAEIGNLDRSSASIFLRALAESLEIAA